MKLYLIPVYLIIILTVLFIPNPFVENEFPIFRVVLDPGHGGIEKIPHSRFGDRYDTISEKYLDKFKEGAKFQGLHERDIVFSIAMKTRRILSLCSPGGDFTKFRNIIRKYTNEDPPRINIVNMITRDSGIEKANNKSSEDLNGVYRLFDYPDKKGEIQPGRLSRINAFKPHLVVSLHLAVSTMPEYQGMNAVIAAPYHILFKGLKYLKNKNKEDKFFKNCPYRFWFSESPQRTPFAWYLNDTSIYFTGFRLYPDKESNSIFMGYRHNMLQWNYRDRFGWESLARFHYSKSRYSKSCSDFIPEGKYWKREQSIYEKYRRQGGNEGFGGDNLYAANEIIRFIAASLYFNKGNDYQVTPGRPYISVYILPIHINAISAYLELGYLARIKDKMLLTQMQEELAEGIAVGIYSLFSGVKIKPIPLKARPTGKSIDLHKYQINDKKTYFNVVSD